MSSSILRIATRQSPLALWQANFIKNRLETAYPDLTIELLGITTAGDKNLSDSLSKMGGKRLFVKELEQALLEKRADIAVHSMKDVPMDLPEGLTIPAICEREDPRDAFVSNDYAHLAELPLGAIVGTSSLRRACQLHLLRPDLIIQPLRGNVDTRLSRLDEKKYTAIILAAAGLSRLGLAARIREYLSPEDFLPAAAQGALGIECRSEDVRTQNLVALLLDHPVTHVCVLAERAINQRLGGGCQVPIAAYATLSGGNLLVRGLVGAPDGSKILRAELQGPANMAQELGLQVAEDLLAQGADKILQAIHTSENGFAG